MCGAEAQTPSYPFLTLYLLPEIRSSIDAKVIVTWVVAPRAAAWSATRQQPVSQPTTSMADVKAEMGLLRLALHRLTRAARSKLVREAGRLIGTSIVLLAASSLFTLGPSSLPHDMHGLQQLVAHMAARATAIASALASLVVGRIQVVLA